VAAMGSN